MVFIRTRFSLVFVFFLLFAGSVYSQVPVANFTVANPDSCAPFLNVTFDASSSTNSPTSFTWDFGDGTAPFPTSNPIAQHNFATPGQYTITLTATNGSGSSAPLVQTNLITVFENPTAGFTTDVDTACSGQPINFTDASTPGDGAINFYSWSFQDGSPRDSTTGATVAHPYDNFTLNVTSYIPQYFVRDVNGCRSIFNQNTLYIKPDATAEIGIGPGSSCSIPATVIFDNFSAGPAIYSWDFGDPGSGALNTSTADEPSHTYNASGSYLVTLISGMPGCTSQDTMTVNVFPPVAGFTVSDDTVCIGQSIAFTNTSTPTPLTSLTFQWNFGDGTPSSFAQDPNHSYINPGTYTVTLTTRLGSCSSTATHNIYVPARPSVTFSSPDHLACNIPFDVTFNADTTSLNVGWSWNFGDPGSGAANTSTSRDPVHTYANFGSYSVKLVVTNIYGCSDSVTLVNYVVVRAPTIDFTVQDSGCVGKIFNFNAVINSPADPVISDYTWDFGDGSPTQSETTPGVTHQYNTVGIYDVTLTITTQSGCTATLTKPEYARVGTPPTATIDSVLDTICFKGTINFNDLTPPPVTGWQWFFGDGQSSTDRNPGHKYEFDTSGVADPFDIILIAYYNGCADTDTVVDMIAVLPPVPIFDTLFSCSSPNDVTFINLSGGSDSYSWNFGDGTPADTATNPIHTFPGPGTYNVILSDSNFANGCKVDTSMIIQITNLTAVANSDVITGCRPLTVQFSGSASQDALAYQWTFGEGIPFVRDTSFTADTLHLYNRPGFYTATLTVIDLHQCVLTDTQVVHVLGPTANFTSPDPTGCSPSLITLRDSSQTDGGPIVSWVWDFGTGEPTQTTSVDSVVHPYNNTGTYTVRLTVTDANGCTHTHSRPNYVSTTKPTAGIIMTDNTGCVNAPELITGNAGPAGTFALPVTYTWDFGDGGSSSSTSNTTTHSYTANGNYVIDLKVVDNNGCRDSIQTNIDVNTTPASFTIDTSGTCEEENGIKKAVIHVSLQSTSNNLVTNWHWNCLPQIDQAIWALPTFDVDYNQPPGNYDISLTVTNTYGCTDTYIEPGAVVVPGPSGSFSFTPNNGCRPLTVDFHGSSINSALYAWDFGDGVVLNDTPDSLVQHTYTAVGTFTPQFYLGFLISGTSLCYVPVPTQGDITVTSLIDVNILEDSIVVSDGERDTLNVDVINGTPPFIYNWTPASQVINGPSSTSFLATTTGHTQYYYVEVPYGSQGCSGFDSVLVIYKPCEALLKIPNVFTPDGNFLNDTYHIDELCNFDQFKFRIYNRWGKIIYESDDPDFHWDGTTESGSEASEGVYYYVLTLKTGELHGYIDLIRNEN